MEAHLPSDFDSAFFLEIAEEIFGARMAFLQPLSDLVKDLAVLLPGNRHDGGEIVKPMGLRVIKRLFHAFFKASMATLPAFFLASEFPQILHVRFVVVFRFNEGNVESVIPFEVDQKPFELHSATEKLFGRINIGISVINRDVEMGAKERQGKARARAAAGVQQEFSQEPTARKRIRR